MNNQLVEIAFILDRSGSMSSLQPQAIASFNNFLADQAAQPGEARLTLVLFNDEVSTPVDRVAVRAVEPLTTATYVPRNCTALLDAIGLTVDRLGRRLAETPEPERPGRVVVAIMTDGLENASARFTWQDIADRIRLQKEVYGWQLLFLGANQDAIATAARMNIDRGDSATYCADPVGVRSSGHSLSRRISAIRKSALGKQAGPDLTKNMAEIVTEEEAVLRGPNP